MNNKKIWFNLSSLANGFIIAGVILLIIGLNYLLHSFPYQDPTLELMIQYESNNQISSILTKIGFLVIICSIVVKTVLILLDKKNIFLKRNSENNI